MLHRFLTFRDQMFEVADYPRSNVLIPRSLAFQDKVKRFVEQLREIHDVALYLQYYGQPLAECRRAMGTLLETVEELKFRPGMH